MPIPGMPGMPGMPPQPPMGGMGGPQPPMGPGGPMSGLAAMLPMPNMNPAGGPGPMPPLGMGVPPPGGPGAPPDIDRGKLILSFLMDKDPEHRSAIMEGVGFYELLKKMDLGKRQRDGGSMLPNPQQSALGNSSPGSTPAAPLAGMPIR